MRKIALAAAAIGAAAPHLRRRLPLSRPLISVLAWQSPLALAVALPRSRARDAGVYALQMFAHLAHYKMANDDPERLRARVYVRYPIRADRVIGVGQLPTTRLQRALASPGAIRPHDLALSIVHWAWYFFPHGTVVYMLLRHPERYARSAALMAATFDAGMAIYWLVPTAPPWWAAEQGEIPPTRRIMAETGERYWGSMWKPMFASLADNPFAAMPSLHFGTSITAAHILSSASPIAGRVGFAYAGTLGFALVYMGEHYVIDLVAGLAVAEGVRAGQRLITQP